MADEAAQKRIQTHMNGQHTRELSHYLRHYAGLSPHSATRPWLKTLDLRGMTIAAGGLGGKEFQIPFTPPLASYAEARGRVVAMDAEARAALGISDVYVAEYQPPRTLFHRFVFVAVLFYALCNATLSAVVPGSAAWRLVEMVRFPGGPEGYRWLVQVLTLPVLGAHMAEAYLMHRSRCLKHGIEVGTKLWWTWVGSTFIEGYGAFQRFDAIVADKKKEKEAKAH